LNGFHRLLSVITVLLALVPRAWSQDDPALMYKICGKEYSPAHPLSWATVKAKNQNLLDERRFEGVADMIVAQLHDSSFQKDGDALAIFERMAKGALAEGKPCCEQFAIKDARAADSFKKKLVLFDGEIPLDACGAAGEHAQQLDCSGSANLGHMLTDT